jgi:homoserine O-acetyltransferase
MGGMKALQWGVSYPEFMDSLVALVPLVKTPAWAVLWLETTRKAIMIDPAWNNGNYTTLPEKGIRLWRDILNLMIARTPTYYRYQFLDGLDILPWLKTQEDAMMKAFDPNDYIYQTWAYEAHDISKTLGMNGDVIKALKAIKAKTLIMTGVNDLLNPEWEPMYDASRSILSP